MQLNLAILTYESKQANLMTRRLLTEFPGQVRGIMASDVIIPGKSTLGAVWFLLRKTGLGFVGMKGAEIILARIAPLVMRATGRQPNIPSLVQMGAETGVPVAHAKNVNALESLAVLKRWQPDVIVSVYLNQLIKKPVIELASAGVINVHPALLPRNRGLFPYFWALANGDTESGVTVHWVDTKFDTGEILAQRALPIAPDDTVLSLAGKSAELGAELLVEAIHAIESGNPPRVPQNPAEASYFSWPTAAAVRQFRQRGRRYGSLRELWRAVSE